LTDYWNDADTHFTLTNRTYSFSQSTSGAKHRHIIAQCAALGKECRVGISAESAAQFSKTILCRTFSAYGYWIAINPALRTGLLCVGTLYLFDFFRLRFSNLELDVCSEISQILDYSLFV